MKKQTKNLPNNKCACQGRTMQNKNVNFAKYILYCRYKATGLFFPRQKKKKKKKENCDSLVNWQQTL